MLLKVMDIIRMIPILIAAGIMGNLFLAEVRKSRMKQEPWFKPYLTLPGVLILVILCLPVIVWMIKK